MQDVMLCLLGVAATLPSYSGVMVLVTLPECYFSCDYSFSCEPWGHETEVCCSREGKVKHQRDRELFDRKEGGSCWSERKLENP